MLDLHRRAILCFLAVGCILSLVSCQRFEKHPGPSVRVQSSTILYLTLGSLSVTNINVKQANASVIVGCQDTTGLSFSNISLSVAANATSSSSNTATFNVGQKAGYLAYGRSISCNVDIVYPSLSSSVDIPLISADNASCWFSYNLFAGTDDVPATSTSWTCSTSGGSYVLTCPSCTISSTTINTPATNSSGLSSGEVQTICLVIGCSLIVAFMVVFGCSRLSVWRHTDARDTRHLPEDAAKDVNLSPPQLFVAHYASQRTIDSPQPGQSNIKKSLESRPPVMIVSYGSQSTPNAHHFHHGAYAMAQPDSPKQQVDSELSKGLSDPMHPPPVERSQHLVAAEQRSAEL